RNLKFVHPSPAIEFINRSKVFSNAMWVNIPISFDEENFLSNDVNIRIRIAKPYAPNYASKFDTAANPQNNNIPMYSFSTENIAAQTNAGEAAVTALDIINVVPNPYYGFSGYESDQLDNRVKITNLPEKCTITIYNVSGTIIRQFTKDDISTAVDWDLKNQAGIPIAGGIYLIHVKANGVGEKVLKWFGALRPVDLNAF
ncbi:MAG: T9SS type A sorting domain-containing protein, partial [Bacteroidales bacterium]|nr:T9SS type A sorting domain-containing protein [Bacteroidales bacterium]